MFLNGLTIFQLLFIRKFVTPSQSNEFQRYRKPRQDKVSEYDKFGFIAVELSTRPRYSSRFLSCFERRRGHFNFSKLGKQAQLPKEIQRAHARQPRFRHISYQRRQFRSARIGTRDRTRLARLIGENPAARPVSKRIGSLAPRRLLSDGPSSGDGFLRRSAHERK